MIREGERIRQHWEIKMNEINDDKNQFEEQEQEKTKTWLIQQSLRGYAEDCLKHRYTNKDNEIHRYIYTDWNNCKTH